MAEHCAARYEIPQSHNDRFSYEPPSVEADVYVWLCALLVVHAKKEDIRKYDIDNNEIHKLYSICSVYLILIMYNLYNYNSRFHNTICNDQFAAPHQW